MKLKTRHITSIAAIVTMLLAIMILGNWLFFSHHNRIGTGDEVPKFNTGLCLLLSAIALFFLNRQHNTPAINAVAFTSSLIPLLIATLTLLQYIFKAHFGIDELFVKDLHPGPNTLFPGRMAVVTACIFILLSITHLLLKRKRFNLLVQIILIGGGLLLSLIFLVYITRLDGRGFSLIRPTAMYTSFTLLILYIGTFFSRPLSYLHFSFERKMLAFFSFVILLLVVVFISFQTTNRRSVDTAKWVDHTNLALMQNQQVLSLAQHLEISAAQFIISGHQHSLDDFMADIPAIHQAINDLKITTQDNAAQASRIQSLEKTINANIELKQQLIAARKKTTSFDPSAILYETDSSKKKMDEVIAIINAIEKEENKLLDKRRADNENSIDSSSKIIILFQVVTGLLLLAAFVVIYKNIQSRNRAEQALKDLNETLEKKVEEKTQALLKSELHFRKILDNLMEGAQIIGFDWQYKYVNDSFLKHAHYSREELIGHTVMEKYPGIEKTAIYKVYQQCFEERVAIHLENEFLFPDNTMGWFDLSFQPVPEGIFILSIDITQRKKGEILLKELNEVLEKRAGELQSSNTELERFAYVASHDLQEPLRMVSSFLHLLERKLEGTLDDTNKQYINFAVDGAERMKKLIQDLLQYSRVGTSKESMTNVDCNEIVETMRSMLALSIHETNATLRVQPLPIIKAVQPQILQLFQNLIGNALKYHGDAPPVVDIGYKEEGNMYEFYIKDNGIGIDSKFFEKIFIIFQRLHNKTEFSGTGIGLSICKKIVERHGGTIRVVSEPGQGSTFYFTIPKTNL